MPARKKTRRGRGIPVRTPSTRDGFLSLVANGHTIKSACEAIEISRSAVHKWMREDEEFNGLYMQALEEQEDIIRGEIMRRGVRGVRRYKSVAGKLVIEREYSDRMLELLAKMRLPEARNIDKPAGVTVHNNTMNVVKMTDEQLADALRQRGIPLMAMDE